MLFDCLLNTCKEEERGSRRRGSSWATISLWLAAGGWKTASSWIKQNHSPASNVESNWTRLDWLELNRTELNLTELNWMELNWYRLVPILSSLPSSLFPLLSSAWSRQEGRKERGRNGAISTGPFLHRAGQPTFASGTLQMTGQRVDLIISRLNWRLPTGAQQTKRLAGDYSRCQILFG